MPNELNANAQKCVDALRSGKYKQGQSCLRKTVNGESLFCCLGVFCDVYREEVGGEWGPIDRPGAIYFTDPDHDIVAAFLPPSVTKWLGIFWNDGQTPKDTLVTLNDSDKYTFAQIADHIESQPEGLFKPPGTR